MAVIIFGAVLIVSTVIAFILEAVIFDEEENKI